MKRALLFMLLALPSFARAEIAVETARLGHGVRVWYSESAAVPVVHVAMSFEGAGSISDPAGKAGRATLAAGMLNESVGPYDSTRFQQLLANKAIDFSIDASEDRLRIDIHCLRDHAEEAGRLVALALSEPQFADGDLQRVKAQLTSMLARMEESPAYQANRALERKAFAGHPYASTFDASPASVGAMTAEDLRQYLRTYVTRGNVLIAAAGDVDASLLRRMLEPVVDALPEEVEPVRASRVTMQGAGESLFVAMPVPQSTVLFMAPALPRSDARFYAFYLLNDILGGSGLTSRLVEDLRQKAGLVYGASSSLDTRDGASLLVGSMATRTEKAGEAVAAVKKTLAALRARGVTSEECEAARTHVIGAFALQLDGSEALAEVLLMMRMYDLGEDYIDARREKFEAIGCEELNALANEFLDPQRFLFVTAGEQP